MLPLGGGEFLKFLIEESDRMAEECGDDKSSTYSRQAAGIAQIVEKYVGIAPRFDSLVREKGYDDELRRLFGSHGGVLESFVAKVIEKTRGREELGRFVGAVGKQGFGFGEGFRIDIESQEGKGSVARISYERQGETPEGSFAFSEQIDPALLQDIIREGTKEK